MISQELKDQFRKEIDTFEESALAFELPLNKCPEKFP